MDGGDCHSKTACSLFDMTDNSSLQQSPLIFIRANPLSLLLVIVEQWLVLISFSWLKLLSLSQDVIGKVNATQSRTCKLGNCNSLQECKASTNLLGMSALAACCCFHFVTHMLYSVDSITECGKSSLYRSAA